ncbi:protein transporter SEC24 [Coprinopsis cinerea okayama7|uniref:Protein transporter SEC24 n=1 Tax=Coprinopsis cinerea (strain Okayama-7 / 130 / ATCC MYA-4618 / FGSC 9003) TaxID=240176 RepID=A8NC46_COPC7|nr:protein transporter SEC24 [Coprinopsis cinerea okayama7\|eukprot:XP_001832390.2 protein transporter SEC24 [Coprinopsis cinerea okayama7\
MYPHPNHIPQPPHSAGLNYKGLRPRIDPGQVPSPLDAIESDRLAWVDKTYGTLPGTHAPLCTSDFVAVDQGNASPKFVRVSTWNMPSTSKLASDCKIPISAVFQPFAHVDLREEPIPLVEPGPSGPPRCQKCRAYINPSCSWVAGGMRWKCNLCRHETDVASDYFCNLDHNMYRLDHLQRPELNKGTVDFAVPEEYWAQYPPPRLTMPYASNEPQPSGSRPPAPMDYIFAFDVTNQAVDTGFLQCACESLMNVLFGYTLEDGTVVEPSIPASSRIAILTFDETLHFYDLSVRSILLSWSDLNSMMVVADLDEVFAPIRTGLFVSPAERGDSIRALLEALPKRFSESPGRNSALGPAIRSGLAALSGRGGHIILFQTSMANVGPGALPLQPNEDALYDTEKEVTMHKPRDKTWLDIAEECVDEGVGVTMFLAPNSYMDVGSIGAVASYTGGEIFFHPRYDPARDRAVMESQLQRVIRRMQGFNCTLRVRTCNGLRVSRQFGNFLQRNPTDVEFGILDADKAITVELEHSGTLDPRGQAHLQCAVLYTSVEGQRRVRVINLSLNVVELAGNVFQYADMETTLGYFAREGVSRLVCVRDLRSYLRFSDVQTSPATDGDNEGRVDREMRVDIAGLSHSMCIGDASNSAFRALPAFILALQKTKPLKARHVSSDVRNYEIHKLMAMDLRSLIYRIYPRLLALHDLDQTIALPQERKAEDGSLFTTISYPSCTRASHYFMESGGIYLIDNEEVMIFWVGTGVSPQLLQDLFGVDDFMQLSPHTHYLPTLDSVLSRQVNNILNDRYARRGRLPKMYIARQNTDGTEIEFSDMLVEDQNNGAMSYLDYLAVLHKQITNVLNGNGSFGSASLRSSPW